MADVVCPHCNSLNPASAEICWNCEASLVTGETAQESTDWLSELRSGAAAPEQDDDVNEDILKDVDETPDWLRRVRQRSQSERAFEDPNRLTDSPGDDLPDWLKDLQSQPLDDSAASHAEDSLLPAPAGGVETSAWAQQQPEEITPEAEEPAGAEPARFSGEIPEWLSQTAEELPAENPAETESNAFSAELPDWLSELPEQDQDRAETAQEEDLPSWLFNEEKEEQLAQPVSFIETPESDAAPNWFETLAAGDEDAQPPVAETPSPEVVFADSVPADEPQQVVEEAVQAFEPPEMEMPQPGADEEPSAALPETAPELAVAAFEMDELPDWLAEERVDLPATEKAASSQAFTTDDGEKVEEAEVEPAQQPFSEEDLPAWLTAEEQLESEPLENETLARSVIPTWIEAMRPVDTDALSGAATSAAQPQVETAGPLAGLAGILPVESAAIDYGRPPNYTMRLRISDKQRASAALLETVIDEEGKPKELHGDKPGIPQAIFRFLIGILLITVILLSGGLTGVLDQGTGNHSINAVNFTRQLDQLPIGGTILVAIEYDPGYAGEMTLAGKGVLEHLIAGENRLVMVSTALAGPVLADELVASASPAEFAPGEKVANLGFLPGGIMSLKEFSLAPQVAARYGMDWVQTGRSAWQAPPLQDIQQVTDFSLVLVLTDSGDTGRMWIEQISPHLGDVPLMMVTTAQAAPILTPYLTGGQLDGLISGLSGGRSFGSISLAQQLESAWAAFRAGILVTVALILIGAFFRGISSMIPGSS
ncbi:MAG: hypothetical protein ROW52_08340 [Anaerolineaceae bacterium]|jgi:hypothetical protein